MAAEDEGAAPLAEEEAALAEEEEMPLLSRSGARRSAGPTYLEGMAADWGCREDDDVPIAHLRRREAGGPSGVPEELRDRPGGPSLESVGGRLAPEREEAFPVLFPDRDILLFAQERLIESSKIWSAKSN